MDKEYWKRDKAVPDVIHGIVIHFNPDSNSDSNPKHESSDTAAYSDCSSCENADLEFAQSI
jgi:hypothetical protein